MTKATVSMMGPLQLLRKVRDVMATSDPPQDRLDQLVRVIAKDFGSEVCSIYLMRAGDVLELYANVGLNQSAVHLTRLGVGEGLVGEIAALAQPGQCVLDRLDPYTGWQLLHPLHTVSNFLPLHTN